MSKSIKDQLSRGFTQIPRELFCAMYLTDLTGSELSVLMFVIQMTYGFHQESRQLSVSYIATSVNRSERTVKRSLKSLVEKGIVFAQADYSNIPKVFRVNPNINQWCGDITDTIVTEMTGQGCHRYGDTADTKVVTELTPNKIKRKEKSKSSGLPPTLEDVQGYCDDQNYTFDAEKFYDTYQATGWKSRGSKITDWKALAAVWQKTERCKSDDDSNLDVWGNPIKSDDWE